MVVNRYMLAIIFVFIVSRAWVASIGVTFDNYDDVDIVQLLPIEAMKGNLVDTIFYNHMQPPLYSVFMYIIDSCFLIHVIWCVLGVVSSAAIYSIMLNLLSNSKDR